ncbi:hypothetical protein [Tenuifilum thalassicum]|uniref:Uncharacterized protein n=1 Tax=Tenuifilum thalassicum TaxID=2590900 RepID=A0A7D4BYX5_9BACT|nr:hypothetical protein [Tenuifilum thalassicum]QKG79324.1 hypothetical protein FHG85_03275 [Tenuifilum thalassicum]
MKASVKISFFAMALVAFTAISAHAQSVVKVKPAKKVVVVKKTRPHRVKKVVVYHPRWAHKKVFHHRWVYFPRYNFYWDNVREVYVYKRGTVWVTSVKAPEVIVNADLENEKQVELSEDNDNVDEVYLKNDEHQKLE